VGGCCLCSSAQRSRTMSGTTLAARRILTGPALQHILGNCSRHDSTSCIPAVVCWAASIGHPRQLLPARLYLLHPCSRARSPLIRQTTRRFDVAQTATTHQVPSNEVPSFQSEKLSSPGGVCGPFIRRGKGSARGDFQGENRGLMVQDVPSARSRSGGFLTEGSPKGRIGMGRIHHPGC